jgi:hypothetical protein
MAFGVEVGALDGDVVPAVVGRDGGEELVVAEGAEEAAGIGGATVRRMCQASPARRTGARPGVWNLSTSSKRSA